MCPDVTAFILVGTVNLEDNSVTAAKIASNVDVTAKGFDADKVDGKDANDSASNIPVLDANTFSVLSQVVGNVPSLDTDGKLVLTGSVQIGTKTGDLAELWDKTTKLVFADVDSGEFNVADKFVQLDASADVPLAQIPDALTGKDATDNLRIDGTRSMTGDLVFDDSVDRLIKIGSTEMMRFESDASAMTMGVDIDANNSDILNANLYRWTVIETSKTLATASEAGIVGFRFTLTSSQTKILAEAKNTDSNSAATFLVFGEAKSAAGKELFRVEAGKFTGVAGLIVFTSLGTIDTATFLAAGDFTITDSGDNARLNYTNNEVGNVSINCTIIMNTGSS